jgi:hypothetical protein
VSLCHNTLRNYFTTNFNLITHHKYSLSDLENLIPYERDIYVGLLIDYIKEENRKIKEQQAQQKRR